MEWDSAIIEQTPDTRITWKSANSPVEDGIVSFTTIYEATRVTLQMTFDPARLVVPADGGDPKTALCAGSRGAFSGSRSSSKGGACETGGSRRESPAVSSSTSCASDQTDISRPGQIPD